MLGEEIMVGLTRFHGEQTSGAEVPQGIFEDGKKICEAIFFGD